MINTLDALSILESFMIGDTEVPEPEDFIEAAKECLKYWALSPDPYTERELIKIGRTYITFGRDPKCIDKYFLPTNYYNNFEYNAPRKRWRQRTYTLKKPIIDKDKHYDNDKYRAYYTC